MKKDQLVKAFFPVFMVGIKRNIPLFTAAVGGILLSHEERVIGLILYVAAAVMLSHVIEGEKQ